MDGGQEVMIHFIELVPFWEQNPSFEEQHKEYLEAIERGIFPPPFPPEKEYLRQRENHLGQFPYVNIYPNERIEINMECYEVKHIDLKKFNSDAPDPSFYQTVYLYKI